MGQSLSQACLVDAELIDADGYLELGESSVGRVKKVLGALHAAETNESGGKKVSAAAAELTNKFVSTVERIFSALPKPVGWQSFYNHSLPLVTKLDAEVRELAIENRLNKSQTKELAELKNQAPKVFREIAKSAADGGVAPTSYCPLDGAFPSRPAMRS